MKILDDFKKSRTVRLAWAKQAAGVVAIIMANVGYFENSMSAAAFGGVMIGLGVLDYWLRSVTTEPL